MKRAAGFLVVAVGYLGALSGAHAGPSFNDPADVKAISNTETYLKSQTDMNKVMPYYGPAAIVYDVSANAYLGTRQIYQAFEPRLAKTVSRKLGMADLNIVSDGTMACAAMQLHYDVVLKSGGTASYRYREIDVLRNFNGKWQIVQSHLSFPLNFATGMTVLDGPIHLVGQLDWGADTIQTPAMDPTLAKAEILRWVVVDANTIDVGDFPQLYGPDANTIIYDAVYPGDLRGVRQYEDYYRPFFANYRSQTTKITRSAAVSDGLLGAVIDQQIMELTAKDGRRTFLTFRQSDCLHRVNGRWYSFFEMSSFPADLQTGRSITGNALTFKQ